MAGHLEDVGKPSHPDKRGRGVALGEEAQCLIQRDRRLVVPERMLGMRLIRPVCEELGMRSKGEQVRVGTTVVARKRVVRCG